MHSLFSSIENAKSRTLLHSLVFVLVLVVSGLRATIASSEPLTDVTLVNSFGGKNGSSSLEITTRVELRSGWLQLNPLNRDFKRYTRGGHAREAKKITAALRALKL
jgi:hypothetical protein